MNDVSRILVVSRSTGDCKNAVRFGVSLARAFRAELSILHIEYDPFERIGFHYLASLEIFKGEYQERVKQIREEISQCVQEEMGRGMFITEIIEKGEPVEQTLLAVEKYNVDLIIIASHPEGRIERVIYGRSNHELMRRLPCSILFVKGDQIENVQTEEIGPDVIPAEGLEA